MTVFFLVTGGLPAGEAIIRQARAGREYEVPLMSSAARGRTLAVYGRGTGLAVTMTVSDGDLRAMMDVVNAGYEDEPREMLPDALLEGLTRLVPCDTASFFDLDTANQSSDFDQQFPRDAPDDADFDQVFWSQFWNCAHCSYPERTGDYRTVTKTSDFYSERQWHNEPMYTDYLRLVGVEHKILACLPVIPGRSLRLGLDRGRGDFSERDRLVLALLRPHLHAVYQDAQRRRAGTPKLTARQWELLRLVAAGNSNAEIALQLFLSESTVRKHLENIFERLDVCSRTAAVAKAFSVAPAT